MRKPIYLLAVCAALVLNACKKDDGIKSVANVDQDITYSEEVDLPDVGLPGNLPFNPWLDTSVHYAFATDYQTYLSQYNTSADKVIHAKLKKLSFRITAPPDLKFDFIESMKVYVYGDGLPERLAGEKTPVPKGVNYFELDIQDQDLKEYFLKDSVRVRLNATLSSYPLSGAKIDVSTIFNLLANPLN